MTGTVFSHAQFAALLANKPRYVAPSFGTAPYICEEIFEGDVVSYTAGTIAAGYPAPSSSVAVLLDTQTVGTSYTAAVGDAGRTIKVRQTLTNPLSTIQQDSSAVAIAAMPTFKGMGLLGVNVMAGTASTRAFFFNNAVFDGRGFGVQGTGVAGNISLDAGGWPAQACELVLSTPRNGIDGQLAAGTYQCTYKSVGQGTTLAVGGATLSNVTQDVDGVTTHFTLTLGVGASVTLTLNGAIQYMDIPRDGTTPSASQPTPFWDAALAHYAQFSTLRFMDFTITNVRTDVNWSDRPAYYPQVPQQQPYYAWEWLIRFINAVVARAGSKVQKVWVNVPGRASPAYATALATLFNTFPVTSAAQVELETGNEAWNPGIGGSANLYKYYLDTAGTETQCISNYGFSVNAVSTVVGDGTTATVTTTAALPAFVTTGASMFGGCNDGTTLIGGTPAAPVTVTKTGTNTFTYPCSFIGNASGKQWSGYFNPSSNLVNDGAAKLSNSLSVFNLPFKYYVRQAYAQRNAWAAVRAQDKWILGLQLNGGGAQGGSNFPPIHLAYAAFLNSGSATWLDAVAIAPYSASSGSNTTVAQVLATLNGAALTTLVNQMRSHIWNARTYGLRPVAYEGGPDLQAVPSLQSAVSSDPGIGTFVTTLLDSWFQNGGGDFHFYSGAPGLWIDGNAQGAWTALQDYTDTTSVKFVALKTYATARNYANVFGAPGTLTITNYQTGNGNINGTTGIYNWSNNTTARNVDFVAAFPRTRRYQFTVVGTDSVNTTDVSVYIDGVLAGTSRLPNGGDGANSGSTASAVANPFKVTVSAGAHVVSCRFAIGVGTGPGVLQVAITAV